MTNKVRGNGKGGLKNMWFLQMIENKDIPGSWTVGGQGFIVSHIWQDRWLFQYNAKLSFKRVHSIHEISQMFLFDSQKSMNEFLDSAKLPAPVPADVSETNTPLEAPGDTLPATFESGEPVPPPSSEELLQAVEELE